MFSRVAWHSSSVGPYHQFATHGSIRYSLPKAAIDAV
jgi:hypothetical protein